MVRHQAHVTAQPRSIPFGKRAWVLSACAALSFLLSVNLASAATDIQGAADDLRIKAQNATIVEILDVLKTRFKLVYRARSFNSRPLTGIYSGTLRETLARILVGNDYILDSSDNGLEIIILGTSNIPGATAQVPPPSEVTTAPASFSPPGVVKPNPSLSPSSPPPLSNYLSQNAPGEAIPLASNP